MGTEKIEYKDIMQWGMLGINQDNLCEVLATYNLERNDIETIKNKLDSYIASINKKITNAKGNEKIEPTNIFKSVPQLVQFYLGGKKMNTVYSTAKKQNTEAALSIVTSSNNCDIECYYRGDKRTSEDIIKDDGFWGMADGILSLKHARFLADKLSKALESELRQFMQDWKRTTAGSTDSVPFVAAGISGEQKSGEVYRINIPLKKVGNNEINGVTPVFITDTGDLENASVIALCGKDEAVFFTGIPAQYISHFDEKQNKYVSILQSKTNTAEISTTQKQVGETADAPTKMVSREVADLANNNGQNAAQEKSDRILTSLNELNDTEQKGINKMADTSEFLSVQEIRRIYEQKIEQQQSQPQSSRSKGGISKK